MKDRALPSVPHAHENPQILPFGNRGARVPTDEGVALDAVTEAIGRQ